MKLMDKKTGEIWTLINRNEGTSAVLWVTNGSQTQVIESIEELTSRFEDYEEPKRSALDLTILTLANLIENEPDEDKVDLDDCKQLLEKLKAWQRLEKLGFRFIGETCEYKADKHFGSVFYETSGDVSDVYEDASEFYDDLDLLLGGEE